MFNDYFSKMVEEFYMADVDTHAQELETVRFTANIALKNLQMIDAIASRFNTSRASIIEEALNHAALSLFISLHEGDRETLAEECDKNFDKKMREIYKENGGSYDHHGLGSWQSINHSMRKADEESKNA